MTIRDGDQLTVVVQYPDDEAMTASRIAMAEVMPQVNGPVAVNQGAYPVGMGGGEAVVVITHPDEEAREAARFRVFVLPLAVALDLPALAEAFAVTVGLPGNPVHWSETAGDDPDGPVCGGCGDYLHKGSDGRLYDSSGDPQCWAAQAQAGPHVARQEISISE